MKIAFVLFASWLSLSLHAATPKPSALELVGKWEGTVVFGKFKFALILRVVTNAAGRIEVTMDMPEQGQKDLKIDALLFNPPDFRLEIDQFGTAYNGKVNEALTEIDGEFEEGPGGRPERLVFKRSTQPDAPEPERKYSFAKGEPLDIRGYWKGEIEMGPPGMKLLAALNIGRLPDGTFRASIDLPEQGAKGIPAASLETTNNRAIFRWTAVQSTFDATLSDDGNELSGAWAQGPRTNMIRFKRLSGPLELLPKNLSFVPDQGGKDVRGYWKGTLEVPGRKLRLVFKIGRTPEGAYAGTLSSIDQGSREIPMSEASFADSTLKMEVKGIRGKYEGKLSDDENNIEGTWEQFGNPMPLKLQRTTESEANSKP